MDAVHDGAAPVASRPANYDLVVLDVMLPNRSGFEVLKTLRQHSNIPVILLTARDSETDRVVGLELGSTIAFAVVTESVFAWPGMGKLIIDSINVLDRPVIVSYLMMIVLLFIVINLLVDILYTLLDPRIRLETKG